MVFPHPILWFHPFPSTHLCPLILGTGIRPVQHCSGCPLHLKSPSVDVLPVLRLHSNTSFSSRKSPWMALVERLSSSSQPPCPQHQMSSQAYVFSFPIHSAQESGRDQTHRGREWAAKGDSCAAHGSSDSHQPYSGCPALCHCLELSPFSVPPMEILSIVKAYLKCHIPHEPLPDAHCRCCLPPSAP